MSSRVRWVIVGVGLGIAITLATILAMTTGQ